MPGINRTEVTELLNAATDEPNNYDAEIATLARALLDADRLLRELWGPDSTWPDSTPDELLDAWREWVGA